MKKKLKQKMRNSNELNILLKTEVNQNFHFWEDEEIVVLFPILSAKYNKDLDIMYKMNIRRF